MARSDQIPPTNSDRFIPYYGYAGSGFHCNLALRLFLVCFLWMHGLDFFSINQAWLSGTWFHLEYYTVTAENDFLKSESISTFLVV